MCAVNEQGGFGEGRSGVNSREKPHGGVPSVALGHHRVGRAVGQLQARPVRRIGVDHSCGKRQCLCTSKEASGICQGCMR